ncbi:methyltransferase domain-containing protein [Candidatus Falkowbacteria bacterium]|nr:methyltransferase domain-containing protein [Candidatus Falkowbacteria bacterium]
MQINNTEEESLLYPRTKQTQIALETYSTFQPLIKATPQLLGSARVLLDVGCAEGIISLEMARDLNANRIILADIVPSLSVQLPENAEFVQVDVCCRSEMFKRFRNQVDFVTCVRSFHLFRNPLEAAISLFGILPQRGIAIIWDYSEGGLVRHGEVSAKECPENVLMHQQKMRIVKETGLGTDIGIRKFWEGLIFPHVPGISDLVFNEGGHFYMVLYQARQWGEVKVFPQSP